MSKCFPNFTCRTSNVGVASALIRDSCHRRIKRLNSTVSSLIKLLFQPRRWAAQTCNDLLPNQYIRAVARPTDVCPTDLMAITQALDALGPDAEGLQGGGGHGGGFGGGGFHGGGFHGGFAGGGLHGGGFHGRFHGGFHRRAFAGSGFGPYYDGYYHYADNDYYDDGGCYVVRRRVMTRYGWRVRPVQVCG